MLDWMITYCIVMGLVLRVWHHNRLLAMDSRPSCGTTFLAWWLRGMAWCFMVVQGYKLNWFYADCYPSPLAS